MTAAALTTKLIQASQEATYDNNAFPAARDLLAIMPRGMV